MLAIYGVGFGQTSPVAVEGIAATIKPLCRTQRHHDRGFLQDPSLSGAATNRGLRRTCCSDWPSGLYQINVTVPLERGCSPNSLAVTATVGSAISNTSTIAILADGGGGGGGSTGMVIWFEYGHHQSHVHTR